MKPDDMSQDIWDTSVAHVGTSGNTDEERILVARAIMAEREACAKLLNVKADIFRLAKSPTAMTMAAIYDEEADNIRNRS